MKKEDLLSDEFLKQFKTGEDLYGFLAQLQKRGIEKILEGELDAHLGYDKHQKTTKTNARNGFSNKKLKHLLENPKFKSQETETLLLTP
ncbi:transposase [Flavobacterium psychrophilum]|nr:transposase [Flavobacterium psychrophilum]